MIDDTKQILPKARTEQLIVKEVDDEVLVYDIKTDQAHCLNKTAALVWQKCDGRKSIADISTAVGKELNAPVDERVVWLALDQLEKFKLLEEVVEKPTYFTSMNRRQLVRTIGVAALSIPVIVSIAAPAAEAQGSCRPKGFSPCTPTTDCCIGVGNCNPSSGKCN